MNLIVKSYGNGYGTRTAHNARNADLTVAFAVSFASAGERLTKKVSGDHYVGITIPLSPRVAADQIITAMNEHKASILNIAGNGIYTLCHHKHTQEDINQMIYETLGIVHAVKPISKILSGGQTGIDIAGAAAAVALDIDAVITFPSGYLHRKQDGVDVNGTQSEMVDQINAYASGIKTITNWPEPSSKRLFTF